MYNKIVEYKSDSGVLCMQGMRRIHLILFLLSMVFYQADLHGQYCERFIDGELGVNPTWSGDVGKFIVEEGVVQLNASSSGEVGLSTTSKLVKGGRWEIDALVACELNNSNFLRYYLASTSSELSISECAVYLQVGGVDRTFHLVLREGDQVRSLIIGERQRIPMTGGRFKVIIECSTSGDWRLSTLLDGESMYKEEGHTLAVVNWKSSHSGITIKYNTSGKKHFYIYKLCLTGDGEDEPEPPIEHSDVKGVIINEIMVDPDPPVGLPNAEYIELYNPTENDLVLDGCTLLVNSVRCIIEEGRVSAAGYLILTSSKNRLQLADYGRVALMKSWGALVNTGALIQLIDQSGTLVDWVEYHTDWYESAQWKSSGGWSIERKDAYQNIHDISNWSVSSSKTGGTPGMVNSVVEEHVSIYDPQVDYIAVQGDSIITIHYSKSMDLTSIGSISSYQISGNAISKLEVERPQGRVASLFLNTSLDYESRLVEINGVRCESGLSYHGSHTVSRPMHPQQGDIVINELLPYPISEGAEFVELFNLSDRILDLSTITFMRLNSGGGESRVALTNESVLFHPGSYVVLTTSRRKAMRPYGGMADLIIEMPLPALYNTSGTVSIYDDHGEELDRLVYIEKMHHPMVLSKQGVSLERICSKCLASESSNWTSASASSGYATPGRENSQKKSSIGSNSDGFALSYDTFTPNNDGDRDWLEVTYNLDASGYMVTAEVFTSQGVRVKRLLSSDIVSQTGYFIWDGTQDNGCMAQLGVYVLFVEAIHPSGTIIRKKLVVVLSDL